MHRFAMPDLSEEPRVDCAQCGATIYAEGALYDTNNDGYLCDDECYHAWADGNISEIIDYYYDRNIE